MEEDRIAVAAGVSARGERLRAALARSGLRAESLPDPLGSVGPGTFAGIVADLSGQEPAAAADLAERLAAHLPLLVVGTPGDLPALEQAVAAGAMDFAVDPGDEELAARIRRLLRHEWERIERAWADRFRQLLEANRRLRELSHQRQELLESVAHDLREPLEAALATARILAARPGCADAAGGILAAGRRIGALLDELDARSLEAGRPGPAAPEEAPRPRTRPAILVVEDDPDTRALTVELLDEDFEVLTAADGEEGVAVARSALPDAVLLDLYLPRLDGFGALEELRRDPRTAEIPVIFLSAQRDDLVRARGLHLGAADFVVKPFSGAELRARIERLLQATRKQAHLRALAQQDALTGLPNFGAFRGRLEEEVKRARRYRNDLAAVMLDLDNLKPVNDTLGHAAGNRAIVAVADAIREELRETDFAARYGGDEFVILLPHADAAHARTIAERLRRAVKRIAVDGGAIPLRASFGVAAMGPGADGGGEALVRSADAALYRAKRTGRDRVCVAGEAEASSRGEETVHEA